MTWRQVPELFGFVAQPAWSRVFAAKPLLLLDEASYSLYLLHAMPIVVLTYVLNLAAAPHILCIMAAYLVAISLISIAVFLSH